MPQSDEAAAFFTAVYRAIQEIPEGRVTTYAHIARLVGTPQRPRQVGVCLKQLSTDAAARFNSGNVPWQRVINSRGGISPRSQSAAATSQAAALRAEGVHVAEGVGLQERSVDLAAYGWFPDRLPSEEEGAEEEESEEEGGEGGSEEGGEGESEGESEGERLEVAEGKDEEDDDDDDDNDKDDENDDDDDNDDDSDND